MAPLTLWQQRNHLVERELDASLQRRIGGGDQQAGERVVRLPELRAEVLVGVLNLVGAQVNRLTAVSSPPIGRPTWRRPSRRRSR